jgi:hypothetical protein
MFNKDLDISELIWGTDAGAILGISRATFNRRRKVGAYPKVRAVRKPIGFMYSLRDVLKVAHPKLNDRDIEKLVAEYRQRKSLGRGKK